MGAGGGEEGKRISSSQYSARGNGTKKTEQDENKKANNQHTTNNNNNNDGKRQSTRGNGTNRARAKSIVGPVKRRVSLYLNDDETVSQLQQLGKEDYVIPPESQISRQLSNQTT